MAAFSTMMPEDLPPAGNPISIRREKLDDKYPDFYAFYLSSGTAALALAMQAAKQLQKGISDPEVIIPAYGCPDLVSAAVYARLKPVLCDIQTTSANYDKEKLQSAIGENTVAVVAVNFLGIGEDIQSLKEMTPEHCSVIEDNAQCYDAIASPDNITSDIAITSFGRGKPVSTLGGGLCLIRKPLMSRIKLDAIDESRSSIFTWAKIHLYNKLIKPSLYPLINRNPLLPIGETKYNTLEAISAIDPYRKSLLADNIRQYRTQQQSAVRLYKNYEADWRQQSIENIQQRNEDKNHKLLRFPVTFRSSAHRNEIYKKLTTQGLGASIMYAQPLANIAPIDRIAHIHSTENAHLFSDRLMTLPCHNYVNEGHIDKIDECIRST